MTCKSFWRVCDFDSVFLTIKKIKERFLRLNPTVYNLKLHKSDKNSRNLPRWPITDLPTMCLSLLCFCSLIITAHKALDFKLISIDFFFSDALGTCTWRNQRSLKASVSSTICLRSESDMSCTVEGYLGRFDWVQQVNSLARPIIYTTTVMDKSLGTLCISGAFSNSHRSNPSPHPTINAGRVYPEFFFLVSTLCRVGGGQTAKKFWKGCTILWGNREMKEKYE